MSEPERGSRKRAIRLKCLDCCCGSAYEVRLCNIRTCPLWRFRLGAESKAEKGESGEEAVLDESQPDPMEDQT